MTLPARNIVASFLLAGVSIAVTATFVHAQDKSKTLLVCAEPHAMPRTGKTPDGKPQGVDLALAEAIARALGRTLEVHWCASPACSRRCLREGRCNVILGHPHDPDGPKDIAWSVPYAGSQFGLIVPKDAKDIRSITDLRGKRIGIVAGTLALSEKDYQIGQFKSREELLDKFHEHKLSAAFLDADFASWHMHQNPALRLQLVKDYVPREHWNMALAVRAKSAELLVDLNKALAELADNGRIRKIYADQGVAYRPPFTGTARRMTSFNTWKRIQERGIMAVSMDPANLPYSSAGKEKLAPQGSQVEGFDVELLRALAKEMGVKLRIDWLDVHRATAVGKLLDGSSDLAFGTPIDDNAVEDDDDLSGKLLYSRPYYGTGYMLVTRKAGPSVKSLAELKGEKSRRLGAEAGSVADYRLRQRGYLRNLYRNQLAVLKSLHDGDIDYAYLWANVGWTLHASPDFALRLVPGYIPEDRWNIAVAMRPGDEELKKHVDTALEKLIKNGTVERVLRKFHVPYFAAFPEDKSSDRSSAGSRLNEDVIRHPVADRGLEPKMQRVETSKNPYGGLERIRSAGALVVGLDHRNLPFATAHPKPAGLDYEIAQLLAGKLGVSLRIYWALSAHDSYPSRLATKKYCDVILGVTPDARFGNRVLYSRPYYLAGYQYVVRDSKTPDDFGDQLAIEQGALIRGLPEKVILRSYPNAEAILEAVAEGKEFAGYLISTRGQWLAQQKWPGKLSFFDGAKADRFPICAAVRKTEPDLKDAIDHAFIELAESGELNRVFARWHVPYLAP